MRKIIVLEFLTLDGVMQAPGGSKEDEADKFASDFLIPPKQYREFIQSGRCSRAVIQKFATDIGIAPGIVVGRLQHDHKISYSFCNDLRKRFAWRKAGK